MKYKVLATDYDGTIAHHGDVDDATVRALEKVKETGRNIILVTGRELPDLFLVFPRYQIFDWIVAENGALLYQPQSDLQRVLAPPPPPRFAESLREKGVKDLSVGRVIVATLEPYHTEVADTIREQNLQLQIILNKGAVMVLPSGINKATGLAAALSASNVPPAAVVAVGDAENDHSLLEMAGYSVAVANALPSLKEQADWCTSKGHGEGVQELIARLLDDTL